MLRKAAVGGQFYPDNARVIKSFVERNISTKTPDSVCAIAPHAGYTYSGAVAVRTLSSLELRQNIIILGPNHRGVGQRLALSGVNGWSTPDGSIPVNLDIVSSLSSMGFGVVDNSAHELEHSIEVLLPILQNLRQDIQIIPVAVKGLNIADAERYGSLLGQFLSNRTDISLVVSSDMNHFEDRQTTDYKDMLVIEELLRLDTALAFEIVCKENVSMCGIYPSLVALSALKYLGVEKGTLLERTDSGFVNGDDTSVVGYAGIIY